MLSNLRVACVRYFRAMSMIGVYLAMSSPSRELGVFFSLFMSLPCFLCLCKRGPVSLHERGECLVMPLCGNKLNLCIVKVVFA